jgi:hypothetical protein
MTTVTANVVQRVRPEVPEMPEIKCRIYYYSGARPSWQIIKGHNAYGCVPRGAPYIDVRIPSERESAYLEKRAALLEELVNNVRIWEKDEEFGTSITLLRLALGQLDALDAAWRKEQEAENGE